MGHRALVAYERTDGQYTLHYSHWGASNLKLKHRISAESPFGGEDTDSKWAKQLLAELADGLEADAVDGYLAVRLKVAEQGVDFVFEPILRRLLSEVRLVDVNVAEQEETVRAVAAAIIDQERVTAELRPRDGIEVLGVDVVVVIGKQELEVEGCEPSETGFGEHLRVYPRLDLGERSVVVFLESHAPRGNGFNTLAMYFMCEFTGELMKMVEVGVEIIVTVDGPNKTPVAKPFEDG